MNIAYLRLSKEDDDSDESQSISSQRACIREYIRMNDLPDDFEELVDDGYSGTHFDRPGIRTLMRLIDADRVGCVIVRDLSRFARNYLEAGNFLEYVFPAHGVRFISVNDGYDSGADGEVAGLHIAIKNLLNQMYSRDISKKVKSAVDLKKLGGEFVYGTAPFGYKKGERKNTIVVDEKAAEIVRMIFGLAKGGMTISEISRKLNVDRIVTPSVYLAPVRGNYKTREFWTYESVRNILQNRVYTGDTEPFRSRVVDVGSDHVKHIPESERVILRDTHEAIIDRETFEAARKVVKSNKKSPRTGKSSILSGYLVCGCCGNKLTKGKKSNKTFYCASARYNPDSDCAKVRFDEEELKELILSAFRRQCELIEERGRRAADSAKKRSGEIMKIRREQRAAQRELEYVKSDKMSLYEDYVSRRLTKDEYFGEKEELNKSETEAKAEVDRIGEKLERLIADESGQLSGGKTDDDQKAVIVYKDTHELDDNLVRQLLKCVVILPNKSVEIEWNFKDLTKNVVPNVSKPQLTI